MNSQHFYSVFLCTISRLVLLLLSFMFFQVYGYQLLTIGTFYEYIHIYLRPDTRFVPYDKKCLSACLVSCSTQVLTKTQVLCLYTMIQVITHNLSHEKNLTSLALVNAILFQW